MNCFRMKYAILFVASFVLCSDSVTFPQVKSAFAKTELFGGPSVLGATNPYSFGLEGWNGSLTRNLNNRLGFVLDLNGEYYGGIYNACFRGECEIGRNWHSVMAGPQLVVHKFERFRIFGRLMAGSIYSSGDQIRVHPVEGVQLISYGNWRPAVGIGGGLDVFLGNKFYLRVAQCDYIRDIGRDLGSFAPGAYAFQRGNVRPSFGIAILLE